MGIIVQDPEVVPEGGYGWVCVVCVFLVNACTWGVAAVSLSHLSLQVSSDTSSSRLHLLVSAFPPFSIRYNSSHLEI